MYRLIAWFGVLIVAIIILKVKPGDTPVPVSTPIVIGAHMGVDHGIKDRALGFLNQNMFQDAATWLEKGARKGDTDAAFRLGKLNYEGKLGKGKAKEGARWLSKAAEEGHVHAKFLLAAAKFTGKGLPQDHAGAIALYQDVAALNYSGGDTNLGWIFHGGHGVPQDFKAGLRHGSRAAKAGNADAQFFLAMALYTGHGVERNVVEAIEWCRKAAGQHHNDAQRLLAAITLGSESAEVNQVAIHFFEEAAGDGDVAAMENLAWIYTNGVGTAQDYKQAIHWYEKAAQKGHQESQYNLGLIYEDGRGVEPDFRKAYHWYDSAAKRGYVAAFNKVGEMHRDGKGVPANPLEALTWFGRAQAKGNAAAVRNLAAMHQKGIGVEEDWDRARTLFRQAAEAGDAEAQLYMGWMHKTGEIGAEVNYEEAIRWYTMAVEQGQSHAQFQLGEMYQKGKGVQRDQDKALELFKSATKGADEKRQEAAIRSVEARELPRQFINNYTWSLISAGEKGVLESMENVFPEIHLAFSLTPAKALVASISELEKPATPAPTAVADSAVPAPTPAPAPTPRAVAAESGTEPDPPAAVANADVGSISVEVSTPPPAAPVSTRGSGWVCDYGLIVTNYHLVKGRQTVHAMINGKREPCEVFAVDEENGLALLKPTANIRLPAALPISGRRLRSGDRVYAIGHESENSESGIVYVKGTVRDDGSFKKDNRYTVMMSITSEHSGGPLLNERGQVVGIVMDKQPPPAESVDATEEPELIGRRNYAVNVNRVRVMLHKVRNYDRTRKLMFGTDDIDEIVDKMRGAVVVVMTD